MRKNDERVKTVGERMGQRTRKDEPEKERKRAKDRVITSNRKRKNKR